jgi:hypothetical protein
MSIKNSSDTTGNRTPDLSACTVVSQQNAPPRAPNLRAEFLYGTQIFIFNPFYSLHEENLISKRADYSVLEDSDSAGYTVR